MPLGGEFPYTCITYSTVSESMIRIAPTTIKGIQRFPPSVLGKATTFMHVTTVCLVLLANIVEVPTVAVTVCFYVSFGLVIVSGFNYIYRVSRFVDEARQEREQELDERE